MSSLSLPSSDLSPELSLLSLVTLYSFYCKSVLTFKASFNFPLVITTHPTNQKAPNQARKPKKLFRSGRRMGKDSESLSLIFSPVTLVKLKIRNSNLTGMLWGLPYEYIACTQNMLILSLLFLDILKHEVSDVNYVFIIECMERAVKQKKRKTVTISLTKPHNSKLTTTC